MKQSKNKTVFVGLSGGVDSSVAALRLQRSGYNVVGVFIKVWQPDFLSCNWESERLDAMRVAAHLEIPFLTCDAEQAYKQGVADYFIAEYSAGRTPNPDVMCNAQVKFGAFLEFARSHGADYVATGHYVEKREERTADDTERSVLLRGVDNAKDQSYFLWMLTQKQLTQALFPVGDTPKNLIRAEAAAAGIPVAAKRDSQGICFLGQVDVPDFLKHFIELQPGQVLDKAGSVIGTHDGSLVYTLGQRHGFTINTAGEQTAPHYVVSRNITENTITVDTKAPIITASDKVSLTDCVWNTDPPVVGETYLAQFRYRQTPFQVTVAACSDDQLTITPNESVSEAAAGQSCVLYTCPENTQCLGGGIIS